MTAGDSGAKADPVVICRCEELTQQDIVAAYEAGYRTPAELRRKLRCGMGPCQGRTCTQLVLALLARLSGSPIAEIAAQDVPRPPLKPTPLAAFAALAEETSPVERPDPSQPARDPEGTA